MDGKKDGGVLQNPSDYQETIQSVNGTKCIHITTDSDTSTFIADNCVENRTIAISKSVFTNHGKESLGVAILAQDNITPLVSSVQLHLECDEDSQYEIPEDTSEQQKGIETWNKAFENQKKVIMSFSLRSPDRKKEVDKIRCDECSYSCNKQTQMMDHKAIKHGVKHQYKCSHCKYVGDLNVHMKKHFKRKHISLPADKNIEVTTRQQNYTCQKTRVRNDILHIDKDFNTKVSRVVVRNLDPTHSQTPSKIQENPHENNQPKSVDVGTKTDSKDQTTSDLKIVFPKPYNCQMKGCNKSFRRKNALNEHVVTVHGDRKFVCTECNKTYSVERRLKAHMTIHTTKFKCKYKNCKKQFRDNFNLQIHSRTHQKNKK